MNCRDFREIIDSYLCDELLTETNHEVLRHLEVCANCRGVIETRRILRARIKSAVVNAAEFQMSDDFYGGLCARLKQASAADKVERKPFWTINKSMLAFAASIIFVAGLGVWFMQTQPEILPRIDVAQKNPAPPEPQINQEAQKISFAETAAGDHQNCAVKYKLEEPPVEIDLASAQYADLRQAVLMPLKNSTGKYELLESHSCKYKGHTFTHIVFRHQGKIVSVLLTDSRNYPVLESDEVAETQADGYQVARFDVKNKAVFVVSNLSEPENLATAKILESPLKKQFLTNEQAAINSIGKSAQSSFQPMFIGR